MREVTARRLVEPPPVPTVVTPHEADGPAGPMAETDAWRETSLPDNTRARLRMMAELPDDAPTTVPFLCRFLEDSDPRVRQAAAESLGRISDPRALGALHNALTLVSPSD